MTSRDTGSSPSTDALIRIAEALERLAPPHVIEPYYAGADAYIWVPSPGYCRPVEAVSRIPLKMLAGIDRQRDSLLENTRRFAHGLPANNALLWGARGMGKSSLVKAVHAAVTTEGVTTCALVEIAREDIASLPVLLDQLRDEERRFILFCDDLSFEAEDTDYKSLKAVLEGGLEGRPNNVIFYATSNRRHLMPRQMIDNERATAVNPGEAIEEKVSLSDRFGLWLGFHACSQDIYLDMVRLYHDHLDLGLDGEQLDKAAIGWARDRGGRSGRIAWQFVIERLGAAGRKLPDGW
ncbi:MAG: ATP-binding protein [Alphaproteobacteria bacterium]